MKIKIFLFALFVSVTSFSQMNEKKDFSLGLYYGVKALDYYIPSVFFNDGVKLSNTNNIGIKANYFILKFLSIGLQFDYKRRTMKNRDELSGLYEPFTFEFSETFYDIYYSPANGSNTSNRLVFLINTNIHIINKTKFNWSFYTGLGYTYENYKSSVTDAKIEELNEEKTSINDYGEEYTENYTFKYFPKDKEVPLTIRFGTNLAFKLSEKLDVNVDLGIGVYNLALGVNYKFRKKEK